MPYADPEKRREVKRKYEQEKRKQRRTNWMLVFYEDQCPEWREELDELGMPTLVSPSHDADEWTERDEKKNPKHKAGTLKEPHRHLLAMYDNPVSYDQVVKDFAFLKSKNVKYVKSLPAMARYLTHMDSPDKAQYDPEGVCEFGGADWRDLCATTSDKHLALREMRAFIRENNVVDFYLFWDWCDEHNDEWSRLLDDSCCYAIEHYMRSFRASMSTPFGSCPGHDGAPPEILPRARFRPPLEQGAVPPPGSCSRFGKNIRSEGGGEVNQDQDGVGA